MFPDDLQVKFIRAATWFGALDEADQLLAAHPGLATASIYTAAATGNADAIRRFVAEDPGSVSTTSLPYNAPALVYLCLSRYLRLQRDMQDDFLRAATVLLDAGADPNGGFTTRDEFESALYGAAGVAHNAPLTQLLLERGADPNDGEAVYHSPETYDSEAMKSLVKTGKLTAQSLVLMLIRKLDWHDEEGLQYLLEHGANPNDRYGNSWFPIHHALARCNGYPIIKLLLDFGADPHAINENSNAIVRAAREGRDEVLRLYAEKGISTELTGVDQLIAACAFGDEVMVQAMIKQSPDLVKQLISMGGELLARFCLSNNEKGVKLLLDLGIDVNTPYRSGDLYFGIQPECLAIHVASWLAHPGIVKLLIQRGSQIDVPDKNGDTPLALAVRACVDSYWMRRRSPDIVRDLLEAGAPAINVPYPCGYDPVDELLRQYMKP